MSATTKLPLHTFGLCRRDGQLFMENVALADIAQAHGTPTFVYSRAELTNAFERLDGAIAAARQMGSGRRKYMICYAVKANSNLAILAVLARLGAGFDIVSGGELQRVLKAGGRADRVVFSGLGKTIDEMAMALKVGIKCFNVESEAELIRLNSVAVSLNLKAPISLRVNPDVDAKTHPYISTGLKNNKFGVAFDRAGDVYRLAATLPGILVRGVDCHIGSQLTDPAPLIEAMEKITALSDQLARSGIQLQHICPGGGLGIKYSDETEINVRDFAASLQQSIGDRDVELLIEPGRAIVGNAGVLLTRVEYVKPGEHKNFLIVDAAMNDLMRPALYQAHHEIVEVDANSSATPAEYDVVGPICESADVLGYARTLSANAGELIAILSAGAYGFVMASNYNSRPRAAEVMVDGALTHIVRERETFDTLIADERVMPD